MLIKLPMRCSKNSPNTDRHNFAKKKVRKQQAECLHINFACNKLEYLKPNFV